jgi:hypothetical protein
MMATATDEIAGDWSDSYSLALLRKRIFARSAMFGGMGIVALVGEERQILFVESC